MQSTVSHPAPIRVRDSETRQGAVKSHDLPRRVSFDERLRLFLSQWVFSTLHGVTWGDWWRLLRRIRFQVDPRYFPRAMFITFCSVFNSSQARREEKHFASAVRRVRIHPPVFILGHYRTGTTYLHYLLTLDKQFAFPNMYQGEFPHCFLTTEPLYSRLAQFLTIRKRPMDEMAISMSAPMEDEVALCVMTFLSPYMGLVLPRGNGEYDPYLTFRGVAPEEVERWKAAFTYFLKKLTYKYNRPLVLKSPPHTSRLRLLLEMFPDARFIHIHRNPYTVFQSTKHLLQRIGPLFHLQRPDAGDIDGEIIRRYTEMYDAFFEERGLIRTGRFHEIGFEALEEDTLGQMENVYRALNLGGYSDVEPALREYVALGRDYRKNTYRELPAELRQRIATAWRRSFNEWDYAI